jgi:hypothetical protein
VEILDKSNDQALRGYCAISLAMIGEPSVTTFLRDALTEGNPPVTIQAALGLCLLGDRDSSSYMLDLLTGPCSEATKAMISRSVVHLSDPRAPEELYGFVTTQISDQITYMICLDALSKLAAGGPHFLLDRVAAGSNACSEFRTMADLLHFGI